MKTVFLLYEKQVVNTLPSSINSPKFTLVYHGIIVAHAQNKTPKAL
jgi:hypothetical protein